MRKVTFSMGVSADGYFVDSDGGIDWGAPSDELFRFSIDEIKRVGVHLMGRRLYETMLHWERVAGDPTLPADQVEWIDLWNPLPKVVFSRTLSASAPLEGNARLAKEGLAQEIERLRAEPDDSDIAIGGAELAAQAMDLDLIDEYWVRVFPVLIGGGTPFFAAHGRRVQLELVDTRTFESGVVFVRYRVQR